jgi:hypothetical protein
MKVLENIHDLNVITPVFLDKMLENNHSIKLFGFCIKDIEDHLESLGFSAGDFESNGWQVDWDLGFTGTNYNLILSGELWYKNHFVLSVA